MAEPTRITIDGLTLTRVLYTDALIEPAATGLTAAEIDAVSWNDHRWSFAEQIRVGAAAWVASRGDDHVVIDPFGNADDIFHDPHFAADHHRAIADAFDAAGVPIDAVTTVVLSHIEGLGISAVRATASDGVSAQWVPFFPNATITVSETSRADFESAPNQHWTSDVWGELFAAGLVDTYPGDATFVEGMTAEWTGAHNPGHHVFHFGADSTRPDATYVGHLAVSPLHLATGACEQQHLEPQRAWELLQSFADDGRILLGPLWPSPGAGRWTGARFVALDS